MALKFEQQRKVCHQPKITAINVNVDASIMIVFLHESFTREAKFGPYFTAFVI